MLTKGNLANIGSSIGTLQGLIVLSVVSVASYIILTVSNNFSLLFSYLTDLNFSVLSSLIVNLAIGYPSTVHLPNLTVTLVTSLLIAVNVVLLIKNLSFGGASGGFSGSVLGLMLSGCAACTTGALSLAGFSIGISFLPLGGLEFGILSILLLTCSALWISEKGRKNMCEV